jgi:hypothetical protein
VTVLAAILTGTTKCIPLLLSTPGIVLVLAMIVSTVPSFLKEWAFVSHMIVQTVTVACATIYIDICQDGFVPVVTTSPACPFLIALNLPLLLYHMYQFLWCGHSFESCCYDRTSDGHY